MEAIALFGRVTVLPFPTICLVRGGAVAGGCMLAFAHDYVYVAGKALFSTNESQNQMLFPPGMMSVIKKRHAYASTIRDMIILSQQFSA
jgi:enoyl-CoA hydratase/carnithine racemase